MSNKMRSYRKGLGDLQRDAKNANIGFGNDDGRKGFYSIENEQRATLDPQRSLILQGHESLNRTTDSIARSHRIAAETDAIGHNIVEELGGQREQLERTKDRLINTGENLSKSRKILRSMSRKIVTNKLLLSIIIILELAILGGVVYVKFFRKTETAPKHDVATPMLHSRYGVLWMQLCIRSPPNTTSFVSTKPFYFGFIRPYDILPIFFWIIQMLSSKLQTGPDMYWLKQEDMSSTAGSESLAA
ncbi:unnamed protein product [Ranitomeya imitator]|uniref:t-SNARE coiled-coil homology domain-containing protein n=1 Tax=Ranitomeya imitator TaxID=111125 RepID=A0ABN9LJK1_9NEOB|nr:unnamed protein product [Ranitomeya imitator]